MDEGDDPFDAWGDEPDWAREDGGGGSDGNGTDDEDVGKRNDPNADERQFGARHVLILIDCNPSMFVPCVAVSASDEDEDEEGEDDDGDGGGGDEDVVRGGNNECERKKGGGDDRQQLVSPFDAALMAAESLLKTRIRYVATSKSGKRDGVGVLLYGTRRREENRPLGSSSSTTTHELAPLSPPGVAQVLRLRDCLPAPAEIGGCGGGGGGRVEGGRERDLRDEFEDVGGDRHAPSDAAVRMGNATLCPLRSALHEANRAFRNAKCVKEATASSPGDSKTLWIFTNEDDPCRGGGGGDTARGNNEEERRHLIVAARDATDNGMDVHVWPLPKPPSNDDGDDGDDGEAATDAAAGGCNGMGGSFDRDLFYNHVTTRDDQVDQASSSPTAVSLDDFLSRVGRQWKRVRRALCLPLLFPGCENFKSEGDDAIMLDFYRVVQNQSRPKAVQVHQETNKTTVRTSQMLAVDSGEIIEKKQQKARIRRFMEFGGERIPFTQDEFLEMKKQSHANREFPSLILLGFKPTSSIPIYHSLDKSYFVYPNEEEAAGSRAAFSALHAAMIRKGVLGIGELVTRATFVSRLVAIVPQEEVRVGDDGDGGLEEQVTPPGWAVYTLPYEDDVRAVDSSDGSCVVADQKTVNAARELIRYQQIQGIEWDIQFENPALKNFWDYIESVALGVPLPKDTTDDTKMDVEAILASAGEQIAAFREALPPEDEEGKNGKKRKAPAKISSVDSHGDWLKMSKSGTLEDCTVDLLKTYLRSAGLKLGGKKDQLVQRVKEHLESENHQSASVQEKI